MQDYSLTVLARGPIPAGTNPRICMGPPTKKRSDIEAGPHSPPNTSERSMPIWKAPCMAQVPRSGTFNDAPPCILTKPTSPGGPATSTLPCTSMPLVGFNQWSQSRPLVRYSYEKECFRDGPDCDTISGLASMAYGKVACRRGIKSRNKRDQSTPEYPP
jgi:hypothetical protein